jgi:hypothetical protein
MKNLVWSGILILALAFSGCDDFLDINRNPNNLNEASINSILPAGQVYSTGALGYTTQLVGSFWVQHYTQNTSANQYNNLLSYNLDYTHTFMTAPWLTLYRQTIPSLRDLKAQAEKEGELYGAYIAVSEIMEAFNWHILNSLYDRICYAEGQMGEANLNPKFETAEESYSAVLVLFEKILLYDAGRLQVAADGTFAGLGKDMIFDGDMEAWLKFANTVYLKMLLRDFTANRVKIQAVLDGSLGLLDEYSGDAKYDRFENLPDKSNPLYEGDRRQLNSTANIRGCSSLIDYLNANSDPRVEAFFEPDGNDGYSGGQFSTGASGTSSRARLDALDPVYFASVAEACFLKAEAYARLNNAADAKASYDAGVIAAFDRWELDGSTFVDAGGDYEFRNGTVEEMIEQIMIQKWIASARCQAWDAWFDLNRTGYPKRGEILQAHSGSLEPGTYPQRFLYPGNTIDYNSNHPEAVKMNVKLWWQK